MYLYRCIVCVYNIYIYICMCVCVYVCVYGRMGMDVHMHKMHKEFSMIDTCNCVL